MFANIKHLLGAITLHEEKDLIKIEGISSFNLSNNIYEIWRTSKIFDNIFTSVSKNKIVFNKFFALDILYTIEKIISDGKRRVNYRALRKVVKLLKEESWLRSLNETHSSIMNIDAINEFTTTPLPHQIDFINTYNEVVPKYNLNGFLLAAAPGSGKTLTSLFLGSALETDVTIIISPKNAVDRVWNSTIQNFYKRKQKYWSSIGNEELKPGYRFYIFHYEQLERALEFFKQYKDYNKIFIVLDECHNLNDIESLRTSTFISLCKEVDCKHVLWMSGTPIKAIGSEAMPLLSSIDPYFDKDASVRFKAIFGKSSERALDILKNRMGLITFKIDKQVVVGNTVNTHTVSVRIPNGEKYTLESIRRDMAEYIDARMTYYKANMSMFEKQYNDCLALHYKTLHSPKDKSDYDTYCNYIKQIRKNYDPQFMKDITVYCNKYELQKIVPSLHGNLKHEFKNVRSIIKYYQLKVQGEALGRILSKQRAQCHVDMIPYIKLDEIIDNSINKTVIFTSYTPVVDEAFKLLTNGGYTPLKVYGDTNKNLPEIVKQFDINEDINPLVATFQSLSTAVPLTMANTVVMMNSPFRQHEYDQALSRCDRLGQTEIVEVYNVLLDTGKEPNISTRANDIMAWSKAQVESILGLPVSDEMDLSLESIDPFIALENQFELPVSDKPLYLSW